MKQHECKLCGEFRPFKFYSNSKSRCIDCSKRISLERYHDLDEPDKQAYKNRSKAWQDDNILCYRWRTAKSRAEHANIVFDITEQDVAKLWNRQQGICYYTNGSMVLRRDNNRNSVSIDRLDPNIGYVLNNIVLCCSSINIMKNDLSVDEFYAIVETVYLNRRTT